MTGVCIQQQWPMINLPNETSSSSTTGQADSRRNSKKPSSLYLRMTSSIAKLFSSRRKKAVSEQVGTLIHLFIFLATHQGRKKYLCSWISVFQLETQRLKDMYKQGKNVCITTGFRWTGLSSAINSEIPNKFNTFGKTIQKYSKSQIS